MTSNYPWRFLFSLVLIFSVFSVSLPQAAQAQSAAAVSVSGNFQPKLQAIEEKLETRRKELGIPGMALAIVKDNQIILLKGFGYKDFEKQVAVTPDSQFAIGSATKAFTALSVLMSQDEGKLSINDNPKKHLPYFKINDSEIDKNITVRDLLAHSSGLNRTDLGWVTGKLTREEIIRVAGEAKPTAKLREKFQYQNVMYAAAGEIVARMQKTPWDKFVVDRIFKPLGMKNSNISIKEMQKAKDFSFGYDYNFDTRQTRRLAMRDLNEIAPAGSINSSARDMAEWLRFVLSKGEANGKRLISEASFEEWIKPQMKIGGNMNYGLGWFLQEWNGLKVVQHGGNIDGFNSLVAMIPEKNIGFVMLTNVSGSPLGNELMPIVWENILGNQNFSRDQTKMKVENAVEIKSPDAPKELLGKYALESNATRTIEVVENDGKVSLMVEGQQPYELREKERDIFGMFPLPDEYKVKARRDASGKLMGIAIMQPEGEFGFRRIENKDSSSNAPTMNVEELMIKVIDALGGEANWLKLKSRVATIEVDLVHQGVKGIQTQYSKAPNFTSSETVITALGKPIAKISDYFNGVRGGEETSFAPAEEYAGKRLEDARIKSDFYGLINWRENYKKAEIKGSAKIDGEDAFIVVVFEPEKANKHTIYFSTKTFLPVKLESVSSLSTQNISLPFTETYSDYRLVDGVMIPFKTVNSTVGSGDIVTIIKDIKHNVEIPDKVFRLK
jgi:CubicO group peptidase (beta-lactamase class C family)